MLRQRGEPTVFISSFCSRCIGGPILIVGLNNSSDTISRISGNMYMRGTLHGIMYVLKCVHIY